MNDTELNNKMTQIYDNTYNNVLKYVVCKSKNPSDIPDIVQNVYMKFYNKLKTGVDIEQPEHYIIKIAQNEIFNHYKVWKLDSKNIPVFSKTEDDSFSEIEDELTIDLPESSSEKCDELWKFIQNRDELTFKIFVLYFQYDMKIDDIAKNLEINPSAVKNKLYRTLKQLRAEYNI